MSEISESSRELPRSLAEIRDDFLALSVSDRLQMLLEFSESLPEVPEGMVPDDAWEQVVECQSPVFIHVDTDGPRPVVYATAPQEAPTTRGFASILVHGLEGLDRDAILSVPGDFPQSLGLNEAVSFLRLRGMSGMLSRIQRQVAETS
ncbi:MAG: SufE family protein [Pontimonas sp.]